MSVRKFVLAVLAVSLGSAAGGSAWAATCSRVEITLHNGSADQIKVTKFEYEDAGVWKTDGMFGSEGYQKLDAGMRLTWTRNLEGVGGESTKFKATYQHHIGGAKWGTDKVVTIGPFTCVDTTTKKTLELNK